MEKVGVLLVSYGSRAAAIADALHRSESYDVSIFDADKQKNPFILERAAAQEIGLDTEKICDFAKKHQDKIDFGIVGPEGPIIAGIRDVIEKKTKIPMICPTKEHAIERSKVLQRRLLEKCCPSANPRFRVFDPKAYASKDKLKKDIWAWLDELENSAVVKPDAPATGKGVGVWGDHFSTREELFNHFLTCYEHGPVIIEEKVDGEEFSLQFFSDGKHLIATDAVRDYKRAFDGDLGMNTGGMGSYKDSDNKLPFMDQKDWDDALGIGKRIFDELKGEGDGPFLRGIPLYMAYTCAKDGVKVFEINSRPGDPEIINLLPILEDDFVDVCFRMLDGSLTKLDFAKKASVITYAVPMTYGGYRKAFSGDRRIDLSKAYELDKKYHDSIRIYPGSMELRGKETFALGSRVVCTVGIGDDIEAARNISLDGIVSIDGALWNRWDIGSKGHIKKSIEHMKSLRR
ncbi:MAG: hypothetical protein QMC78_00355 [Methanocellales archaeon]|nr:hypothetical protein [Methanocellales archaeon]